MRLWFGLAIVICAYAATVCADDVRPTWSWQKQLPTTFGIGDMRDHRVEQRSAPSPPATERIESFVAELLSFIGTIGNFCTSMRRGIGVDCGRRRVGFTWHFR